MKRKSTRRETGLDKRFVSVVSIGPLQPSFWLYLVPQDPQMNGANCRCRSWKVGGGGPSAVYWYLSVHFHLRQRTLSPAIGIKDYEAVTRAGERSLARGCGGNRS